ncbi:MAG: lipoprotein [Pseudomonadota bacterium]
MLKSNVNFALYVLLCAICSALMACGTKGPLYIPEQRYPQEVEQPASQDAPAPDNKKAPLPPPTVKDY